jgi:hypothetical protein
VWARSIASSPIIEGGCNGRFTELPVYGGVGNWHFNRFRIAFKPLNFANKVDLFAALLANFPAYINSNYATATWGAVKHGGHQWCISMDTRSSFGIDLGHPHTDWIAIVAIVPHAEGFTVHILKREFLDVNVCIQVKMIGHSGRS